MIISPTFPIMDGVSFRQIEPVNADDPKGLTYEWCKGIPGMQVTCCLRNAGKISGNHYHRGDDPSKNPERMLILSGSCDLITCDGTQTVVHFLRQPPLEIIIQPSILHAFLPKENINFLEYRATVFNPENNDTFPAESFVEYLKNKCRPINREAILSYQRHISQFIS